MALFARGKQPTRIPWRSSFLYFFLTFSQFFSPSILLSIFLLATLTLLPPPVHPPHSFVFIIIPLFPSLHLPILTLAGHSNILSSCNLLFLSSLHLLGVQSRSLPCVLVHLVRNKYRAPQAWRGTTLTSNIPTHIPRLSPLNTL